MCAKIYSPNVDLKFSCTNFRFFCLANSENKGLPGHGAPIDDIDRICHEFKTCTTCLEYDTCNVPETVYEWQIIKEDEGKNLFCADSAGSCQRNLCHCEVNLVQQILEIAHTYNPIYSHANVRI